MRRSRASASTPRSEASTAPAIGASSSSRPSAPCVDLRELEEVVDQGGERVRLLLERRQRLGRCHHTVWSASNIAWMFASGVRRSWLAQATSSRRASNSRSRLAAISLNDACEVVELRGAGARRAHGEVAVGQAPRSVADRVDRVDDRAAQPEPGEDGHGARRPPRRRGSSRRRPCGTSPSRTGARPRAEGRRRTRRGRRSAGERWAVARSATARRKPMPSVATATTTAFQITARACSRRPRRSGDGPGATGRPRSSPATGARAP